MFARLWWTVLRFFLDCSRHFSCLDDVIPCQSYFEFKGHMPLTHWGCGELDS